MKCIAFYGCNYYIFVGSKSLARTAVPGKSGTMSTKPSNEAEPLLTKSDRQAAISEVFHKKSGKHAAKSEDDERREAEQRKTARLRALRLAKEAGDSEVTAEATGTKATAKKPDTMRLRKTATMAAVKA